MKEFKGTPGEWKYTIRNVNEMMTTFHGVTIGDTYIEAATRNEIEDAQLIAAAPDLLDALQSLFDNYKQLADSGDAGNWRLEDEPAGKKALHAINKALGKE
ncbi:hypothetical protein ABKV48_15775 [Enterobacter hormaechei]